MTTCLNIIYKYFKPSRPDPKYSYQKRWTQKLLNKELNKKLYLSSTPAQWASNLLTCIIYAIRHFVVVFPKEAPKKITIHGWKKMYLAEVQDMGVLRQ